VDSMERVRLAPRLMSRDFQSCGNMPGDPSDSSVFPQRMLVDYVRTYSRRQRANLKDGVTRIVH
jgi:hypothetical protein